MQRFKNIEFIRIIGCISILLLHFFRNQTILDIGINHHAKTYNYIYNVALLRAFGGIGTGYFIAQWYNSYYDYIKTFKYSARYSFL